MVPPQNELQESILLFSEAIKKLYMRIDSVLQQAHSLDPSTKEAIELQKALLELAKQLASFGIILKTTAASMNTAVVLKSEVPPGTILM